MELCHHFSCTCKRCGDLAVEQPRALLLTLQTSVVVRSCPPQTGTLPMPLKFTEVQGQTNVLIQFHILRRLNRPINQFFLSTIIRSLDICHSLQQHKWKLWHLLIWNFVQLLLWIYRDHDYLFMLDEEVYRLVIFLGTRPVFWGQSFELSERK
jgi:hypothetical protein